MTHREEVIPPYRRAVVDPLGEPLSYTPYRGVELCSLIEGELYLLMKRSP